MRIVLSKRYTFPKLADRAAKLDSWINKGRRRYA
jgi:hypothetical protein